MKKKFSSSTGSSVLIVGHRGARDFAPENGLSGFRHSALLPIDGVEFDVHLTADDGLVVIHDPLLERTAHGVGPVGELTTKQVTAARLRKSETDTVPQLEEVLDLFRDTDHELQVELKTDAEGVAYAGLEKKVIDMVRAFRLEDRCLLTCFVPEVVEKVLQLWPEARVLISLDRRTAEFWGGLDRALDRFAKVEGVVLAVEKKLLALTLPYCLDRFGSERVGVWVPNEPEELDFWLAQPIRHLVTDKPSTAIARKAATGWRAA